MMPLLPDPKVGRVGEAELRPPCAPSASAPELADRITLYMHYEGYGYIARCAEPSMHGWRPNKKTGGPKEAAAIAADEYYGPGNYTLHKVSYKVYEAHRKEIA